MAKKRNTASLIDRFTSGSNNSEPMEQQEAPAGLQVGERSNNPQDYELTDEEAERLQVSPELREALNRKRHENVGRPKAGTGKPQEDKLMYGDTRFTIIVKKEIQQKLKYISAIETRTLKDILAQVLGGYIEEWERKNGNIRIKNQK